MKKVTTMLTNVEGFATVRLPDGLLREAEIHWYEATGIGKREFKIKRYIDMPP